MRRRSIILISLSALLAGCGNNAKEKAAEETNTELISVVCPAYDRGLLLADLEASVDAAYLDQGQEVPPVLREATRDIYNGVCPILQPLCELRLAGFQPPEIAERTNQNEDQTRKLYELC